MEKIAFFDVETGNAEEFYVLETTTLNEIEYLLVTVDAQGDTDALILKKTSPTDAAEDSYAVVEDEEELKLISDIFMEILEDVEIE